MTGYLISYDGKRYQLPVLLDWKLQFGCGTPCDSFEVLCPWGDALDQRLSHAFRFQAMENGTTTFFGVVDEYEIRWNDTQGLLFLCGRGMAALLLDNEAMPADYQTATLDDILRDHVLPYGIKCADTANIPSVPQFSVESGSSEWQVLHGFMKYHGGLEPRFNQEGHLVLNPNASFKKFRMDDKTPITNVRFREKRYGVLSEVVVIDRSRLSAQSCVDQARIETGFQCRRVVCTPGKRTYQEMRYNAEFQLKESAAKLRILELTLPIPFAAWPGDQVDIIRSKPELNGVWVVKETECAMDATGTHTKLILAPP